MVIWVLLLAAAMNLVASIFVILGALNNRHTSQMLDRMRELLVEMANK